MFDFDKKIRHLNELSIGGQKVEDDQNDAPTDYTKDDDAEGNQDNQGGNQGAETGNQTPPPDQTPPEAAPQPQATADTPPTDPTPEDDAKGLIPSDEPEDDGPTDYGNEPEDDDNPDNPAVGGDPTPQNNEDPAPTAGDIDTPPEDDGPTDYTSMTDDDDPGYTIPDDAGDSADANTEVPTADPATAAPDANAEPAAQDPGDAAPPEDDGPTDYTNMDDDTGGGDDQPPAEGDPAEGGGEDEGPTDYTNMDDDGGDGADAGDDANGAPNEDQPQEGDQQQGAGEDLKELENQLFSNLSPQQISIRNIELKTQYIELFNTIDKTITKVDMVEKTEKNLPIIDFISKKLSDLKIMVNDYIIKSFNLYGYLENQVNLQHYLVILDAIVKILEETKKYEEKDRKSEE